MFFLSLHVASKEDELLNQKRFLVGKAIDLVRSLAGPNYCETSAISNLQSFVLSTLVHLFISLEIS
jgi:hypothetical protein